MVSGTLGLNQQKARVRMGRKSVGMGNLLQTKGENMAFTQVMMISLLIFLSGCRTACYIAVGPQSVDEVEFKLIKQKADPNMPEIVAAAIEAAKAVK